MIWLAIVGIPNPIVGLDILYRYRMAGENEEAPPILLSRPYAIALAVLSFAILFIDVIFGHWFNIVCSAAQGLF